MTKPPTKAEVLAENAALKSNLDLFQERLAELEVSIAEAGWQRLGTDGDREFTRAALRQINRLVRIYWLKNPLIKRAVAVKTVYVFGQGVSIRAEHPTINAIVQEFAENRKNRSELFEHQSRMLKETELELFGNLFFVFFANSSTGRVLLRSIQPDEIEDIIYNPEDDKDPRYYLRVWTRKEVNYDTGDVKYSAQKAYYPDWRHNPEEGHPASIGDTPVRKDEPIYHVAVNCLSDMKFGVSEVYAALDWAKAYKQFLENWATIVQAYSRFAMQITAKGGKAGIAAAKDRIASTLASVGRETNPSPVTASMFVAQEGVKLEAVRTSGATTSMDDARRLMLMVSSATGIYETYLTGDPSTGNLATAKTMERPMELMFADRQQLWKDVIHDLLQYVVDQAATAPNGAIPGTISTDGFGDRVVILPNDTDNEDPELRDQPIDRRITIRFPPILEHDLTDMIDAITKGATLGGSPLAGTLPLKTITRLLLENLDPDHVDEVIEGLFPDGAGEDLASPPAAAPGDPDGDVEAMMVAAVSELRQALEAHRP